jgi:glycosyltransferase involved in cell wall biosynthesis
VGPVPLYRGYDGWGESSVDEIVEALEQVHSDRQDASRRAERAVAFMQSRSWGRICEKLMRELFP